MLKKFESKSSRVKGLAFHPVRPWILASLHSGIIQLWDYRMGTLLDHFEEHEGPVRGIDFHPCQPLFASGGDDYKIKVWSLNERRCLFTLQGHLDYIRTVHFHHELPWIVSAGDDQTIRVWNWQNRNCVTVLTGHNHYVMSACFHPKDDLILSASLDQTVRVWDISALKKKALSPADDIHNKLAPVSAEIFGTSDAVVKYVLEGHDRGVNFASFHSKMDTIVSCADDRQVKLWRYNEHKAWEVDTLRGHVNNVSCVLFHPTQDYIISNSEDKSIRVWDLNRRVCVHTFRREHDRFWILAAHPTNNLVAAGHDSGLVVFKLERERPCAVTHHNSLYFVKDKQIRCMDFFGNTDVPVVQLRNYRTSGTGLRTLAYNDAERVFLLCDIEESSYELYHVPKSGAAVEPRRGVGLSAVFVARNRFAVLEKNKNLVIKNFQNEVTKKVNYLSTNADMLFYAGTGQVLLRSDDKITLLDLQQKTAIGELEIPKVKYVEWDKQMKTVALISKHTIVLANKKLEQLCRIDESIRVKSGVFDAAWESSGVFIYTTLNHMKYCMASGDSGIIRTLDQPLYLYHSMNGEAVAMDRQMKKKSVRIDPTEIHFKVAINRRQYDVIRKLIKANKLSGQSLITYLQKKGFPEVALHFVTDNKLRFNLAIECGNIEVALQCAMELEDAILWNKLAQEALRQGNHQIVEMAYQRTKAYEKLSFLFLITGNVEKLRKMLKIAELRQDTMSRFHNALYLGDADERMRVLKDVRQLPLAYIIGKTFALDRSEDDVKELEALAQQMGFGEGEENLPKPISSAKLLVPPTPINPVTLKEGDEDAGNWPLLNVTKGFFDGAAGGGSAFEMEAQEEHAVAGGFEAEEGEEELGGAWGEEELDLGGEEAGFGAEEEGFGAVEGGEGWEMEDDLDLPEAPAGSAAAVMASSSGSYYAPPTKGEPFGARIAQSSQVAADHVAAGSFASAMQLLAEQLGVKDFGPFKQTFVSIYSASHMYFEPIVGLPGIEYTALRGAQSWSWAPKGAVPGTRRTVATSSLVDKLKSGYKAFSEGKFVEAIGIFRSILLILPFVEVTGKSELSEVKELLGICREYIVALSIESTRRKDFKDNVQRNAELASYLTNCTMQPPHMVIALRSAMVINAKIKNFKTAGALARKLMELNPKPELKQQAIKVMRAADESGSDAVPIDYNVKNPFVVCSISLKPIYRGSASIRCPFCGASYLPTHKGETCPICTVGGIGADAKGWPAAFQGRA